MTEGVDTERFWRLRFRVEVSARYHEWRRASLSSLVSAVRFFSLIGSLLAFVALSSWVESEQERITIVALLALFVAVVNALDLVFGTERRLRDHLDLYRRFKSLQEEIIRGQKEWEEHIDEWTAQADAIDRDEPPIMWAIYVECWNQTIEKHRADAKYKRNTGPVRSIAGRFFKLNAKYFPYSASA